MKRSKIIASICASVMCLGLLVAGVYAAVVASFKVTTTMSFNPEGVYVDISGQVYRGASVSELTALTTDPTYTFDKTQNYVLEEGSTEPSGNYAINEWKPNEIIFIPTEKVVQIRINVTNKSAFDIAFIPENEIVIAGLTVTGNETVIVEPGETGVYTITFTADTTTVSSASFEQSFTIQEWISPWDVQASWYTIDSNGVLTAVNIPEGADSSVLYIPTNVKKMGDGTTISGLPTTDFEVVLSEGVEEINDSAFEDSTLANINFPEGLVNIGECAFWGDSFAVEQVIFPSTLAVIEDMAFTFDAYPTWQGNGQTLASLYFYGPPPTIYSNSFFDIEVLEMPIYVKAEHLTTYQTEWANFDDNNSELVNYLHTF